MAQESDHLAEGVVQGRRPVLDLNAIPDIHTLMRTIVSLRASDLHITVGAPPWARVRGALEALPLAATLTPVQTRNMAEQLLRAEQMAELDRTGEVDLSYSLAGVSRFRINVFRQRGSLSLAIRVIPEEVPTLEDLGTPQVLETWSTMERGLLLITGPTGSGKSSTIAAFLRRINETQKRRIITLEDPIEYLHRHECSIIDQREVGMDTKTFASGLRAALREDPDVLVIGEMRDLDTVRTALTAAETGHLVLSTLHTVDAVQAVNRLIDVFPEGMQSQVRAQLSGVLVGIVAQRLIPAETPMGRALVAEVLVNTIGVSNLIRTGTLHQIATMMQTGRQVGMQTFATALQDMVRLHLIDSDQARNWAERWNLSNARSV